MLTIAQRARKLPKGNNSCSPLFDIFFWGGCRVEAKDEEKDFLRNTRALETVAN